MKILSAQKNKSERGGALAGIIIITIILLAGGYFFYKMTRKQTEQNKIMREQASGENAFSQQSANVEDSQ